MYTLRQKMLVNEEVARIKYHLARQEYKPCEFNIIRKDRIIAKILTDDVNILIDLLKSGYSLDHIED